MCAGPTSRFLATAPRRPSLAGGQLIPTLVLAHIFELPRGAERCRSQLLSSLAELPDQLRTCTVAKAQALAALQELPAGPHTGALVLELLLQAGRHAADAQQLEKEATRLSKRCTAFEGAVAEHVREFHGAANIRSAINSWVVNRS